MTFRRSLLTLGMLTAAGFAFPALAQAPAAGDRRQPLLIPNKRTLFQRVILRPGARLSPQPNGEGQPADGFSAFYVYARQGQGADEWMEVGPATDGHTIGWVKAERTIAWNHAMVAAFTNPAGRGRTLFLDTSDRARALLGNNGEAEAKRLRAEAAGGQAPQGVVALEPERYIDISRQFYMLPILSADMVDRETGGPVRVLEVASAPAERPPPPPPPPDVLASFKAGLVFVVDTTMSMQPYIDRTREAMESVVSTLGNTAVKDNFRFGVVGYRDSREASPRGFEYASNVFAVPDFAQPPEAALTAMRGMNATTADNEGFDEDPVTGLRDALKQVEWSAFGGRYIVLITDAGARDASDRLSGTHMGLDEIRQQAKLQGVALFVIHLQTPAGRANHQRARQQYIALTQTDAAGSLYFPVEGGAQDQFRTTVSALIEGILQQVAATTGRSIDQLRAPRQQTPQQQQITERVSIVGQAMRLAYLGRVEQTAAPEAVRSFVLDRDPEAPGNTAIDVRILLTRNQLSDLGQALEGILRAGRSARLDSSAFFGQLRSAFALAARDPSRIAQAGRLGGLLGEYLEGLPYQSEVMDISEQDWLAMGAGAQARILNNVDAKLRLYQEFNQQADLWVTLTGRRDAGEQVFPVPLEALP